MDTSPYTAEELVDAYVNIREQKRALDKKYKDEVGVLEGHLDEIETALLDMCKGIGADSIKTPYGTVMRGVKSVYTTNNWEKLYETIYEHRAFELLERRISNGNMKQFLEENPVDHPPGLSVDTKYTITIRKAK